ncbi:MAG: response regulator transcription factor [Planctomycetes bacterium]|nr:response regulator transcription factor [Planctomycetota bacterium]
MKLLVVEDSERLRRSLRVGLERSGFVVDAVGDGLDGLAHAMHGSYDVVVLDLMLPGIDGLTVLRRLRDAGSDVHVLVLTARDQTPDRIEGLSRGADDYLTKPFDFDELLARIRALVRRRYGKKNPVCSIGSLRIDLAARRVTDDSGDVALTPAEYALLEFLVLRRGRIASKPELLDHLYAGDAQGSANAVEVFVHQLRRKLKSAGHDHVIETRRGHGYLIH